MSNKERRNSEIRNEGMLPDWFPVKNVDILNLLDDFQQFQSYYSIWQSDWSKYLNDSVCSWYDDWNNYILAEENRKQKEPEKELYRESIEESIEEFPVKNRSRAIRRHKALVHKQKDSKAASIMSHKGKKRASNSKTTISTNVEIKENYTSSEVEYELHFYGKEPYRLALPKRLTSDTVKESRQQRIRELIVQLGYIPRKKAKYFCHIIEDIYNIAKITSKAGNAADKKKYKNCSNLEKFYLASFKKSKENWIKLPSMEDCLFKDTLLQEIQEVMPKIMEELSKSDNSEQKDIISDIEGNHPKASYVNRSLYTAKSKTPVNSCPFETPIPDMRVIHTEPALTVHRGIFLGII